MNQAFPLKTRSQRAAGNRALAIRNGQAEVALHTEPAKDLQVLRLRAYLNCSEAIATTLARLVYGEGRRD